MARCIYCGKTLWLFSLKKHRLPILCEDGRKMVTVCTDCLDKINQPSSSIVDPTGQPDCVVINVDRQSSDEAALSVSILETLHIPHNEGLKVFIGYVTDPLNREKREQRNVMGALVHGDQLGIELDPAKTRFQNFRTADPITGVQLTGCAMFYYKKQ